MLTWDFCLSLKQFYGSETRWNIVFKEKWEGFMGIVQKHIHRGGHDFLLVLFSLETKESHD